MSQTNRILYMTDRYGVSSGYEPAFRVMLHGAGIKRHNVIEGSIYNLVESPLKRISARDLLMRFDPAKLDQIRSAFDMRISTIKPKVIVVSCPALLGIFTGGALEAATLEKMRGGVYQYDASHLGAQFGKIPVIITYPITAIHRVLDTRLVVNEESDEEDKDNPYKVQQGANILRWDWNKAGRYFNDKVNHNPKFVYSICRTTQDCLAARDWLMRCELISIDIETGNWPPMITCVGFSGISKAGVMRSFVIPFYDEFKPGGAFWPDEDSHTVAWNCVRDINASPVIKTFQNGAYDCSYFIRDRLPVTNYLLDSMHMWWSLYCELPKTLDFISSVLLDDYQYWKDDIKANKESKLRKADSTTERYWRYCARDCHSTLLNTLRMMRLLAANPAMQHNHKRAHMRMLSGLAMGMRGIKADFTRREEHREALTAQAETAIHELRYMIDEPDFNVNSSPQKVSLLYDVFGLPPRNDRGRIIGKDGKDAPSAGSIPIKFAKQAHPIFKIVLDKMDEGQGALKQISNICNAKVSTNRFRSAFSAVGTETTRFSSKKSNFWDGTNVQNWRKKYRDWLVADDSHVFLDIDFSQSDDVFMAYESQDPEKIKVVESGRDGHAVNGELFFGMPYDDIVAGKKAQNELIVHPTKGIRQLSKRIVHGTNFQMAAMTLYITMGRDAVIAAAVLLGFHDAAKWSQEQLVNLCGVLMHKYRTKYKRLSRNEYYAEILEMLRTKRSIVNAFGDTRIFLGDPEDNGTQREATAFIGQSDTAGNMNRAMEEIDWGHIPERFRDGLNPCRNEVPLRMTYDSHGIAFLNQVHDNFLAGLNLRNPLWKTAANNLLRVMERPVIIHGREVVIRVEAELSLRWSNETIGWNGDVKLLDDIVAQLHANRRNV